MSFSERLRKILRINTGPEPGTLPNPSTPLDQLRQDVQTVVDFSKNKPISVDGLNLELPEENVISFTDNVLPPEDLQAKALKERFKKYPPNWE